MFLLLMLVLLHCRYKFYRSFSFLIMAQNFSFLRGFSLSISSFCFDALNFSKNIRKPASSLVPCNDEKHIFAIYWALYDMYMCVYRKVEDKLPCLKTKIPSCIPKKKLKLCICVWHSMTWLRALESTLPFKTASCNSWETAQLDGLVMLCPFNPGHSWCC